MTLRLPGALADEIRRHGEAAYPAECCGVLAGRIEAEREGGRPAGAGGQPPHRRSAPLSHRAGRSAAARGGGARRRARDRRVLSLASRSSGGPVGVRRRARVAVVQLSHRAGRPRARRASWPAGCWTTSGRSCSPSHSKCSARCDHVRDRFHPDSAPQLHRRARRRRAGRRHRGRGARRPARRARGLKRHLVQDDGRLRNFVNLYLNDTDIRQLESTATPVSEGDVLTIVPSIAGGRPAVETELPKLSHAEVLRYSRHLLLPEVGRRGPAEAQGRARAHDRRRRAGLAARALPGRGGRRHHRHRGLRRGGPHQPPAPDRARHLHPRPAQARVGQGAAHRPQPQRRTSRATRPGSPRRTRSRSSASTTSWWTAPTTSRPATWSTTPACCWASRTSTAASSASRARRRCSTPRRARATAASTPSRRLRDWCPSCAEGGVLGVLPGIIGSIQAIETIKLIIGAGDSLVGRLVLFDALKLRFRELKLRKDPDCPICGEQPDDPRADRLRGVLRHRRGAGLQRRRDHRRGVPAGARRPRATSWC